MQQSSDLFGEHHIKIRDNSVLEKAANRLLLMIQRDPNLLEGDSMGEIDRRLYAEILWEDGVTNLLPSSKKADFIKVVSKAPESDVLTRARRYLLERDMVRLPASVIRKSEQMRNRISSSLK